MDEQAVLEQAELLSFPSSVVEYFEGCAGEVPAKRQFHLLVSVFTRASSCSSSEESASFEMKFSLKHVIQGGVFVNVVFCFLVDLVPSGKSITRQGGNLPVSHPLEFSTQFWQILQSFCRFLYMFRNFCRNAPFLIFLLKKLFFFISFKNFGFIFS
eukprot:EG_transcript_24460